MVRNGHSWGTHGVFQEAPDMIEIACVMRQLRQEENRIEEAKMRTLLGEQQWRTLLDGPMGQPQDEKEIAHVMQQLRDEDKVAAEAQMAEVLARSLPVPACLLELNGKPADELRAIFKASFADVAAADATQRVLKRGTRGHSGISRGTQGTLNRHSRGSCGSCK
jgi:hypothetical protein